MPGLPPSPAAGPCLSRPRSDGSGPPRYPRAAPGASRASRPASAGRWSAPAPATSHSQGLRGAALRGRSWCRLRRSPPPWARSCRSPDLPAAASGGSRCSPPGTRRAPPGWRAASRRRWPRSGWASCAAARSRWPAAGTRPGWGPAPGARARGRRRPRPARTRRSCPAAPGPRGPRSAPRARSAPRPAAAAGSGAARCRARGRRRRRAAGPSRRCSAHGGRSPRAAATPRARPRPPAPASPAAAAG
mmetsp:Transcript_91635/g.259554  ORF Transcript_91635/g.259554 Transcript_91635/m.259554 type:complete len:246 (+) Transcript_91635:290-1027(+)